MPASAGLAVSVQSQKDAEAEERLQIKRLVLAASKREEQARSRSFDLHASCNAMPMLAKGRMLIEAQPKQQACMPRNARLH